MTGPPTGETVPGNRFDLLAGRVPDSPPSVSAIVVHCAQPGDLRRTLDALAAQTHPGTRLEVIVVDDGSPRPPDVPAGVRLLRQPDRGARPGAARTLGAGAAQGEVLCFLDADTAPEPGYVTALTRLPALAPEAVTVGRRRHADLDAAGALSAAPAHELPEPGWLRDGYAATRDLLDADARAYRFVISAVLACSRGFFGEVGGFADFDRYGGEDWEWAHRAWLAGAILAHVPAAVAWHNGPDWGARRDAGERRRVKNDETRRLADLIGVAGSRGRGLRPRRADTVIRLADAGTESQAFLCVDGLLAALPDAAVVVPEDRAALFGGDDRVHGEAAAGDPSLAWPSLRIEVHRPVEVDPARLRAVCAGARRDAVARLRLLDSGGRALLDVGDARALARARRWGDDAALRGRRQVADCAAALEPEPDLEAWVGGWANPRLPPPHRGS